MHCLAVAAAAANETRYPQSERHQQIRQRVPRQHPEHAKHGTLTPHRTAPQTRNAPRPLLTD
ncbi:hypothetical protein, partial [Xanthomonas vasicola]|uniref:hypothetical protein n=1 Tax=Xanthomonas vasicola TaxID=56459 RepID=UPI001F1DB149